VLFKEWGAFRDASFEYRKGDSWDRLAHQGVHLLEKFAQDDRIRVSHPKENLQVRLMRKLAGGNEFLSYIDAVGQLDGKKCLIDWKTTTSRYAEAPDGLLALDPQLICYSWMSGIPDVTFVVFVRKHLPEIQYLKATISEEQRKDFGPSCRNNRWAAGGRPLPLPQRHSLSAKRLRQLFSFRSVPQQSAVG